LISFPHHFENNNIALERERERERERDREKETERERESRRGDSTTVRGQSTRAADLVRKEKRGKK
jgi:hypothetical protein